MHKVIAYLLIVGYFIALGFQLFAMFLNMEQSLAIYDKACANVTSVSTHSDHDDPLPRPDNRFRLHRPDHGFSLPQPDHDRLLPRSDHGLHAHPRQLHRRPQQHQYLPDRQRLQNSDEVDDSGAHNGDDNYDDNVAIVLQGYGLDSDDESNNKQDRDRDQPNRQQLALLGCRVIYVKNNGADDDNMADGIDEEQDFQADDKDQLAAEETDIAFDEVICGKGRDKFTSYIILNGKVVALCCKVKVLQNDYEYTGSLIINSKRKTNAPGLRIRTVVPLEAVSKGNTDAIRGHSADRGDSDVNVGVSKSERTSEADLTQGMKTESGNENDGKSFEVQNKGDGDLKLTPFDPECDKKKMGYFYPKLAVFVNLIAVILMMVTTYLAYAVCIRGKDWANAFSIVTVVTGALGTLSSLAWMRAFLGKFEYFWQFWPFMICYLYVLLAAIPTLANRISSHIRESPPPSEAEQGQGRRIEGSGSTFTSSTSRSGDRPTWTMAVAAERVINEVREDSRAEDPELPNRELCPEETTPLLTATRKENGFPKQIS